MYFIEQFLTLIYNFKILTCGSGPLYLCPALSHTDIGGE